MTLRYMPLAPLHDGVHHEAMLMAVLPSILYSMLQPIQVPESITQLQALRVLVIENAGAGPVECCCHTRYIQSLACKACTTWSSCRRCSCCSCAAAVWLAWLLPGAKTCNPV